MTNWALFLVLFIFSFPFTCLIGLPFTYTAFYKSHFKAIEYTRHPEIRLTLLTPTERYHFFFGKLFKKWKFLAATPITFPFFYLLLNFENAIKDIETSLLTTCFVIVLYLGNLLLSYSFFELNPQKKYTIFAHFAYFAIYIFSTSITLTILVVSLYLLITFNMSSYDDIFSSLLLILLLIIFPFLFLVSSYGIHRHSKRKLTQYLSNIDSESLE